MRKLVKLVVVDEILTHPNADALELAIVGGWQCCVKKGDFTKGSVGLYFEIDSMLPLENEEFAFLAGRNEREVSGVRYARIKTMKLRKELSQGLLMPLGVYPPLENLMVSLRDLSSDSILESFECVVNEFNDVIDFSPLGVIKYEPKESGAVLSGLAKGNFPAFIPKTDQERYQNIKRVYEDLRAQGQMFEVTVKLDGSSFTAYAYKEEEVEEPVFGVCSRNLELKIDQEGNAFVDLYRKLGLEQKLNEYFARTGRSVAIQGEMVGPGIQKNFEGVSENDLYVYDVYDIHAKRYFTPEESSAFVESMGLKKVPILFQALALPPYEEIQLLASGPSGLYGKYREGVVLKAIDRDFSFKAVSNEYLMKEE